jgi:2-hydroxychromene-2-carboxylate isomerase
MWLNLLRKAAIVGIPLNHPAFLPFNPLLALRVSLLAAKHEKEFALIGALFEAVWVRGLHVSELAVVERIASEVGLPGGDLVARATVAGRQGRTSSPDRRGDLPRRLWRAVDGGG